MNEDIHREAKNDEQKDTKAKRGWFRRWFSGAAEVHGRYFQWNTCYYNPYCFF